MNKIAVPSTVDPYIQRLKDSRNKNAVLKYRLAMLRSQLKDIPVLAFEGPEDKIIYYHWLRRIKPDFAYEPFPCSGKKQVLRFREMLSRDLGDLKNRVYFIIDRDFDDLAGFDGGDDIFMTDYYATENYLVCGAVLNELLKNEYHCHARPDVRRAVIELFSNVYSEFLLSTKEINRRLYVAKRLGIELGSHVPEKLAEIAIVELDNVSAVPTSSAEIIRYATVHSEKEITAVSQQFDELDPPERYRGKFALAFFKKWLDLLANDYELEHSHLFSGIDRSHKVPREEITLGNLASKAPLPSNLPAFLASIG